MRVIDRGGVNDKGGGVHEWGCRISWALISAVQILKSMGQDSEPTQPQKYGFRAYKKGAVNCYRPHPTEEAKKSL